MVYGWRGIIGLVTPASGVSLETEFHKIAPEGVAIITTRIPLDRPIIEELMRIADHAEEASALIAKAKPDLIVLGCTTGSLVKGIGYDKEIISRIESRVGIPATTTTTGVVDSLNALKVKKIAIVTPYPDEVNQREKSFMEDSGFEITSIKALQLAEGVLGRDVESEQWYRLVKEIFSEDADAIFISCNALSVIDIIETLEEELRRPVITSNQALIWAALRKIDVKDKIGGLGTLFRVL